MLTKPENYDCGVFVCVYVCARMCVYVRMCVRACVCVCVGGGGGHTSFLREKGAIQEDTMDVTK